MVAVVAGVVLGAVLLVELGGRLLIERAASSALRDDGVAGATVTVGRSWWRPTLVPALLGGGVDQVRVELRDADVSGVRVVGADYVLEDLDVAPDPFSATLGVDGIGRGSFRLVVTPESVSEVLGVPAAVVDGRLVVGPDDEPAKLRVDRADLVVESTYLQREGIDPRLPLISSRFLPCEPEVELAGAAVQLSCSGDRLPGILDTSLGEPVGEIPAPTELEPPAVAERGATPTTATTAPGGG